MRNKRFIIGLLAISSWLLAMGQTQVLTLDSCLNSARQHNCTIRSAALEVAISREVKKQMIWKYFPQVSLTGFAFGAAKPLIDVDVTQVGSSEGMKDLLTSVFDLLHETDSTISSEVKWIRWGVSAQAQAVQPVYWGGQIVTANKLAKLGIDASELKQEVSERDVLQEVTETYWLVAGLLEKRNTVQKATELLDSIAAVAHTAYNHGLVTTNDILRVQLKQNEIQTKALQLENGIQLASRLLCHLIGQEYTEPLVLETFSDDEVVPVMHPDSAAISVEGRPEVKLLEANVRYNQLMKRLTLGESLPHLAIGVTGGYSNYFERNAYNAVAFVSLVVPLTAWGETSHKLKQHDWKIEQAQLMHRDLHDKMMLQNRQLYDQLTESIQLLEQHRSSRDLAKENYRISMMNYRAGVGTMTELMESEALLLQAENAYTDARITYRTTKRKYEDYNK